MNLQISICCPCYKHLEIALNGPSISVVVACLHDDRAGSAARLLELADAAMYQAKRLGRPLVVAGDLHRAASQRPGSASNRCGPG